ncbi:MAG TPA: methylated-DNA--[protein]-cysteine S-methyltransferase [Blastocatellia bacterium]|nr:methylated-DNA--[protein]-cysteine S-methyltransferase [Blastocatellia bacterium]
MRINYTIVDSPLGRLLVAGTEKGVCHISLGDRDRELEAELRSDYPGAEIRADGSGLAEWVEATLLYLRGERMSLDLPVDVGDATDFQKRVWQQLRAIPPGTTHTYGEIARALGYTPASARAVGRACATNPVSLVIPCHRAVREDGGLGGYRWGLERKRALLERESAILQGSLLTSVIED